VNPQRKLLPGIALLVPGLAWTVPLFTQLFKRYPALGAINLYGLALGVVLAIAFSALFFFTGGHHGRQRNSVMTTCATIVVTAVASGILWAPCINALLDFGPETTVTGTIQIIQNPGKNNPSRIVTADVDGRKRTGRFYPYGFWDVAAVRNGGPVQLTIRPGFLGVPWVARFSDP